MLSHGKNHLGADACSVSSPFLHLPSCPCPSPVSMLATSKTRENVRALHVRPHFPLLFQILSERNRSPRCLAMLRRGQWKGIIATFLTSDKCLSNTTQPSPGKSDEQCADLSALRSTERLTMSAVVPSPPPLPYVEQLSAFADVQAEKMSKHSAFGFSHV